jgi:hypothetical protein
LNGSKNKHNRFQRRLIFPVGTKKGTLFLKQLAIGWSFLKKRQM